MTREQLKQKTIGVLMGGISAEREISLRTGNAILAALLGSGYHAVGIDAGADLPARLIEENINVAFIALHGRGGEDGSVQGLLETMRIPYTGSGILASSLAIDKVMTKRVLLQQGLPTPQFAVYRAGDDLEALLATIDCYPVIAKPACEGSTIGVTIAEDVDGLRSGIKAAVAYDRQVLIEEFIRGRETTVSVFDGEALPIIEVVPKSGFYDFNSKYTAGQTEYLLPANFPAPLYARMQQVAVEAYQALGCVGAARVDFMVRGDELFCLEVNTIPGMTATSLLPKAAAANGIDFGELVQRILEGAALNK